MHRLILLLATVVLCLPLLVGVAQADSDPYVPNPGIEATYFQPGPWAVTERLGFGCCDSTGAKFDLWHPSELEARHSIVVWGDGTGAVPKQYSYLLRHLASWGFVVVATENQQTGSGQEIIESLDFLLKQAADPASVFYRKLDPDSVGAMGHSQGASGVLNALKRAQGRIKTAVPLELPARVWCLTGNWCPDTSTLTASSVFLVNGSEDSLISPSHQPLPWQTSGLQSNQAFFEAIPAHLPKVWATLNGPNHNDVQGQPTCAGASFPCTTGVYGYLGYPTAWLMSQLRGDAKARRAFVVGGELSTPSANWSNQSTNLN
ncbi:alpha/beta hydrolase [Nocardia sp. XZ_19_385]|uniref:poly(ethylene terephthalate) hydrolase family protein n=1 Tax=Nocardia sp. XZ_19_385 TaxID=2769488 RepID=UPI0018908F45|nr:alpha/beta hydrolase [Nocardia sp. XZ_19_385]